MVFPSILNKVFTPYLVFLSCGIVIPDECYRRMKAMLMLCNQGFLRRKMQQSAGRFLGIFGLLISLLWTSPRPLVGAEMGPDFVDVGLLEGVKIDLRYATTNNFVGQNLYGEYKKAYLHKLAAEKLRKAALELHKTHPRWSLLVFDALRPRSIQRLLWDRVKGTPQEAYVANPQTGSIHNYGFAVDVSIVDDQSKEIDMGTPFDDFRPLAQPRKEDDYLAQGKLTADQVRNRKLLRRVMMEAGFLQLPIEWWHYDALPKAEIKAQYKIVE